MKKLTLSILIAIACIPIVAQNLQVHYDFGENRKMVTTTVEMFKADDLGSTFFFIDMDYGSKASGIDDGIDLAYWEIARSMKVIKDVPIELRGEYNGGFLRNAAGGFSLSNAWLAGAQYTWNTEDFSKVFTLQANYKYIINNVNASFQITGVWGLQFFDNKLTFSGFFDFWREDVDFNFDDSADAEFIFLSEPQLWYNINKTFSVGGEVEVSNNFALNDGWMVNPTLAVKWTF